MSGAQLIPDDDDWPVRWICIGQRCIGKIYDRGGQFIAATEAESEIGAFATLKQARAAIWEAHIVGVVTGVDNRRAAA